jgi:hypothetical protein
MKTCFQKSRLKSNADFLCFVFLGFFFVAFLNVPLLWAKKTNQAVYETPFDIGAGGASLTMAAKEGRIFANPALLPFGGDFHQWTGFSGTVLTSRESASLAQSLAKSGRAGEGQDQEGLRSTIDRLTKDPLHLGVFTSLSFLTRNMALSLFDRIEPDLRFSRIGETGLPEAKLGIESYHGLAMGGASRTPLDWLSFGVTAKHLFAAEPEIVAVTVDESSIANLSDSTYLKNQTAHYQGTGLDLGALLFFQNRHLDFKIAGKVDDMGHTYFSKTGRPSHWRQVVSAGIGLTFHSTRDAVHLALDYRDIFSAYEDPLFKKIYTGMRVTWHNFIGIASGIYHGHPTYGIELDAFVMRFSATFYTREFASAPGVDARNIVMVSVSLGY